MKAASDKLDEETILFMRGWYQRWKVKSIYQVLLLYRSTRHQDLVYFSQQAHLYNQNVLCEIKDLSEEVDLKYVDPKARASYLPPLRPSVHKLPFRLGDLPYFDSSYICDPSRGIRGPGQKETDETWDAPLQRNIGEKYKRSVGLRNFREQGCQTGPEGKQNNVGLPETPYVREQNKYVRMQGNEGMGKPQVYKGAAKKPAPRDTPPPVPREIVK